MALTTFCMSSNQVQSIITDLMPEITKHPYVQGSSDIAVLSGCMKVTDPLSFL